MLEGFVPYPEAFVTKYRQKGYWVDKTLGEEFDEFVGKYRGRTALSCRGEQVTYRELGERVNRLALHFVRLGLKTYDRMILQLPNQPEFVYCYFAAVKLGIIPIASLPAHQDAEISFFAQFTNARAHAVPSGYKSFSHQELSRRIRGRQPNLEFTFVSGDPVEKDFISITELLHDRIEERVSLETLEQYRPDPLQPAVFQLSGGTTGVPKIIPRTHNDYALNFKRSAEITNVTMNSVMGIAIPVSHNFALCCPGLSGTLYNGGKVVLIPSTGTEDVLEAIQEEKITIMPTPPALLIRWMESGELHKYDISSLETVLAGGARLNPEVAKKVGPVLGCSYHQNLGMGEGMLFWSRKGDPEDLLLNTQGAPMFEEDDEIRIVDENDKEVPAGEPGELLVRGPYTIRGYYNSPEYNKRAFTKDGFYRTGDVARIYRGRYVTVEGRIKDTINRGAEKISAEEVENHILAHPLVENCAFVAMPDPVLGEKGCAFVITKGNQPLTLEDLTGFLRKQRHIAVFKLPERVELLAELPMTKVGKIDKKELRRMIAEKLKTL
ncbi:MAG: 2,3-dihydroxybenzoate-AMP ligase [Deltaproteobacteria bacterium HGW-Deltaproteobacteria-15]|jgi:2,3-dihydroxybenzoate-AMP ligase|nr:MAG: 2,3-dihydroxybenzoate-AMP ligase [Deltaproteobacteria bacterium HGW-Deltaproteobacteria-15]